VKWGIAGLLVLPQSILLGMTFPLMSAGVVRRVPTRVGDALATLYFANSFGAAAGVLIAGFWLVGVMGLPGTLLTAAALNIVVATIVFVAVRTTSGRETEAAVEAAPAQTMSGLSRPRLWRLLLAVSFGTALSSFIYGTFIAQTIRTETGRQTFADSGIVYPSIGLPDWANTAANAWIAVRTIFISGCCAVNVEPAVCV